MSWKSFACLAAVAAMTAPAAAQAPTIDLVDNMDGTASLNITSSVAGALAAEIAIELDGGLTLGTITPNLTDFIANPGDSPFVAGSPIGGDVTGFAVDANNSNNFFASYGSTATLAPAGTYELLTFGYTGSGLGDASGIVAQGGDLGEVLMDLDVQIGGTIENPGDFSGDGRVDNADLTLLLDNWTVVTPPIPAGWDGAAPDGAVDNGELTRLLDNWAFGTGAASAVAVPEPATVALVALGMFGFVSRRK